MGADDDDNGCVEHDFETVEYIPVHGLIVTGLAMVDQCRACGALQYQPSELEKPRLD